MEKLRNRLPHRAWRAGVGVIGGLVLAAGIVMIPYPGPGWAVVFVGLGILATEFVWAQRVLDRVKAKYDAWYEWMARQARWVKAIFWILTCAVVVVTIWLLNGYGLINDWLNLGQDWVKSPIFGK